MAMQPGRSQGIEFIGSDGAPNGAWLQPTYIDHVLILEPKAHDPQWNVMSRQSRQTVQVDWLQYTCWDASFYKSRVKCVYPGKHVGDGPIIFTVSFVHQRLDGSQEHESQVIEFVAWDGSHWICTIPTTVAEPFPTEIYFTLARG